jgi:hypothetical protein
MTPAPTTTIDDGIDLKFRMPSESTTRSSSNLTPAGRAGVVPVAITTYLPPSVMCSPRLGLSTSTVCSSMKRPWPV